jgi:hypothetical protein
MPRERENLPSSLRGDGHPRMTSRRSRIHRGLPRPLSKIRRPDPLFQEIRLKRGRPKATRRRTNDTVRGDRPSETPKLA